MNVLQLWTVVNVASSLSNKRLSVRLQNWGLCKIFILHFAPSPFLSRPCWSKMLKWKWKWGRLESWVKGGEVRGGTVRNPDNVVIIVTDHPFQDLLINWKLVTQFSNRQLQKEKEKKEYSIGNFKGGQRQTLRCCFRHFVPIFPCWCNHKGKLAMISDAGFHNWHQICHSPLLMMMGGALSKWTFEMMNMMMNMIILMMTMTMTKMVEQGKVKLEEKDS